MDQYRKVHALSTVLVVYIPCMKDETMNIIAIDLFASNFHFWGKKLVYAIDGYTKSVKSTGSQTDI